MCIDTVSKEGLIPLSRGRTASEHVGTARLDSDSAMLGVSERRCCPPIRQASRKWFGERSENAAHAAAGGSCRVDCQGLFFEGAKCRRGRLFLRREERRAIVQLRRRNCPCMTLLGAALIHDKRNWRCASRRSRLAFGSGRWSRGVEPACQVRSGSVSLRGDLQAQYVRGAYTARTWMGHQNAGNGAPHAATPVQCPLSRPTCPSVKVTSRRWT
jgi:hypothetical protein